MLAYEVCFGFFFFFQSWGQKMFSVQLNTWVQFQINKFRIRHISYNIHINY